MDTLNNGDLMPAYALSEFDLPELETRPLWLRSVLTILIIILLVAAASLFVVQQVFGDEGCICETEGFYTTDLPFDGGDVAPYRFMLRE